MSAEMASSVFVSVIAAGLAALGQTLGLAVARALSAMVTEVTEDVVADTHPAEAKAISAIELVNRIKSTPSRIVNVIMI